MSNKNVFTTKSYKKEIAVNYQDPSTSNSSKGGMTHTYGLMDT